MDPSSKIHDFFETTPPGALKGPVGIPLDKRSREETTPEKKSGLTQKEEISNRKAPPDPPSGSENKVGADSNGPNPDPFETVDPGGDPTKKESKIQDPFATKPGQKVAKKTTNETLGINPGLQTDNDPFTTNHGSKTDQNYNAETIGQESIFQNIAGYEILKELGRGGMGVVYKARHPKLNRIVALKMILSGANAGSQDMSRFLIEAEAIARLQHPNIIQLYEFGEHEGLPFFTLEYVSGGCLSDLIKDQPLPPRLAAQVVLQIARGIAFAHEKGIVHRDLKPANILVQENGQNNTGQNSKVGDSTKSGLDIKITDFGLAKKVETDSRLTGTNAIMGSPCYMAPEQAKGDTSEIDAVTDVYGIGAILYQLITGRPPFQAPKIMEVLRQVIEKDPLPPTQLGFKLDRDLETICLKCLEKEKAKRYHSATDLASDVERYLNNEPIQARPPGNIEKIVKWSRRKPTLAALLLVSGVAASGLISSTGLFVRYQYQLSENLKSDLSNLRKTTEAKKQLDKNFTLANQYMASKEWDLAESEINKCQELINIQSDIKTDDIQNEIDSTLITIKNEQRTIKLKDEAKKTYGLFQKSYENDLFNFIYSEGFNGGISNSTNAIVKPSALSIYSHENGMLNIDFVKNQFELLTEQDQKNLLILLNECIFIESRVIQSSLKSKKVDLDTKLKTLQKNKQALSEFSGINFKIFDNEFTNQGNKNDDLNYIKKGPKTTKTDWFIYALNRFQVSDYPECIVACNEVLHLQNGNFWANYIKGLCQLKLKNYQGAKATLSYGITLAPEIPWTFIYRGQSSSEIALKETNPKIKLSEEQAAEQDFEKVIRESDGLPKAISLSLRGVHFTQNGKLDQAVADLMESIAVTNQITNETNLIASTYSTLSTAYQKKGNLQETIAILTKGLQLYPDHPDLKRKRGAAYLEQKKYSLAKNDFESVINGNITNISPSDLAAIYFDLAQLNFKESNFATALNFYEKSISLNPNNPDIERFKAETYLKLKNYKLSAESLDKYFRSNLKNMRNANDIKLRAMLNENREEYDSAISLYSFCINFGSSNQVDRSEILNRRGWCYLYLKSYSLAKADFLKAIDLDGNNLNPVLGGALAKALLAEFDQAYKDAVKVEKLMGTKPSLDYSLHYRLSAVYSVCSDGFLEQIKRKKLIPEKGNYDLVADCRLRSVVAMKKCLGKAVGTEKQELKKRIQNDSLFTGIKSYLPFQELFEHSPQPGFH